MLIVVSFFSCREDGTLNKAQAKAMCPMAQQWIPIEQCRSIIDDITVEEDDPCSTVDDVQGFHSRHYFGSKWKWMIYSNKGQSHSQQCKSSFMVNRDWVEPDSVELVRYEDADIGDFENGIPPQFEVIKIENEGNKTIYYLEQNNDVYDGFKNRNGKCSCLSFPYDCKRIVKENCSNYANIGDKFGLKVK